MTTTFNGQAKRIELGSGTHAVEAGALYSAWKAWTCTSDNSKYLPAFRVVGGDPISATNSIAPYFFLTNGWRVVPAQENHTLHISGILLTEEGEDAVLPPTEASVLVVQTIPVRAESTSSSGSSGGGATAAETAAEVMDGVPVEDGLTLRKALRLITSILGGRVVGAGTTSIHFKAAKGVEKDRVVATVDADGNRTTVDMDLE